MTTFPVRMRLVELGLLVSLATTIASAGWAGATSERAFSPNSGGDSRVVATRLLAELSRRASGEWVIVGMRESTQAVLPAAAATAGAVVEEIRAVLKRYSMAMAHADYAELASVWVMKPAEVDAVDQLFAQSSGLVVAVSETGIAVRGDRAWLEFEQQLSVANGPSLGASTNERALRRALGAHDDLGDWSLEDVADR